MKTIAVMMPTYNRPVEFANALFSVGVQERLPDVVMVVGDRCEKSDWKATLRAVKEFKKRCPKVAIDAHNLVNPGRDVGSKPKNYGIMNSKSDLIAYLDDDNMWTRNHLRLLEKKMLKAGADLVWCGSFVYGWGCAEKWTNEAWREALAIYEAKPTAREHGMNIYTPSRQSYVRIPPDVPRFAMIDTSEILHTREALDLLDEPEGLWWRSHMYATDWDLVERLMAKGAKCEPVKKALCHYICRPQSERKIIKKPAAQKVEEAAV